MAMRPGSQGRPSRLTVVLAFGVAVAAAAALVVVALLLQGDGGSGPEPIPNPVVELGGIPQDGPVLGRPAANVTLIEFADPQCPGCRFYTVSVFPAIVNEYIRPGNVKTEFRGFPFIGPDSVKALRFILAAGLQDRLWQLQEALYRYQGGESDGWVTDDLLRQRAGEIEGLDVERLFTDANSDEMAKAADDAAAEAQAAGIPGTPTFFIKIGDAEPYFIDVGIDLEQLRAALDDALAS
jgi:protein-disulfide isomerase